MIILLAVVYEAEDEKGFRDYVAKLRLIEEPKPYSIMARGPRWTNQEVALLVQNRHKIKKVAKVLGRSEEACRQQLKRLGIPIKNVPSGTYIIFPKADADLRRQLVKRLMPKLEKALDKCLKAKELKPRDYDYLIRMIRASAAMFNALEKWQTGAEMLDILKGKAEEDTYKPDL